MTIIVLLLVIGTLLGVITTLCGIFAKCTYHRIPIMVLGLSIILTNLWAFSLLLELLKR